jgi:CRP/FNR family transcriptional regulator
MERRKFKAGEVIFKEGDDPRGEAYVIHVGTVEIRRRFDGIERVLATPGEGELLGDMALFRTSALRSASAVAQSDVELLIIKAERLDWLIFNRPQLTKALLRRLSEMVVATDANRAGRAAG